MSGQLDPIVELAERAVATAGCELVDLQYLKEGSEWILRVLIDKPREAETTSEGSSPVAGKCSGVGMTECREVSEMLSSLLDVADPLPHPYHLEVSSPGLNRPLKKREDFIRFSGCQVKIKTTQPVAGMRQIKGLLQGVEGEDLLLLVQETPQRVPFHLIGKANLEL